MVLRAGTGAGPVGAYNACEAYHTTMPSDEIHTCVCIAHRAVEQGAGAHEEEEGKETVGSSARLTGQLGQLSGV